MCIYCITNSVNGKKYVGQTINHPLIRFKNHIAYSKNSKHKIPLALAMREFGSENFHLSVLEEVVDASLLNEKETGWIRSLDTANPDIGYNVYEDWQEYSKYSAHLKGSGRTRKNNYFGVVKIGNSFRMSVCKDKKPIYKHFKNEIDAAIAYDKARCFLYGKDSPLLNFPDQVSSYSDEDLKSFFSELTKKRKSSKYVGVMRFRNRWVVSTRFNFKPVKSCVHFHTEEEAAEAFDKISLYLRGPDRKKLNFPHKRDIYLSEDLELFYAETTTRKPKAKSSQYRNISYHPLQKKWYVRTRGITVGTFSTEQEAHLALLDYLNQTIQK